MSDGRKPQQAKPPEETSVPQRRMPVLIREDLEVKAQRTQNVRYPQCSFTGYPYRSWTG